VRVDPRGAAVDLHDVGMIVGGRNHLGDHAALAREAAPVLAAQLGQIRRFRRHSHPARLWPD
jgi:hypothetical protein